MLQDLIITAYAGDLAQCLRTLDKFSDRSSTVPVLGFAKITANNGNVRIESTDMDMMADLPMDAHANSDGAFTVKIRQVLGMVENLEKSTKLELTVPALPGNTIPDKYAPPLKIEWEGGASVVDTLPVFDYPGLKLAQENISFSMPASTLLDLVEKVKFAISTEKTRYHLNGIYLHTDMKDHTLTAVATDGDRLSRKSIPLPEGVDLPEKGFGIIVPRLFIGLLPNLLKKVAGDIRIGIHGLHTRLSLHIGDKLFATKLIDETFPEYQRIIPQSNEKIMWADSERLAKAVKLVNDQVKAQSGKTSRVKMVITSGALDISAQNENGAARQHVSGGSISFNSDEEFEIGFQARYVLDILAVAGRSATNWAFADAGTPAVITVPADPGLTMVLAPKRISP